MIDSGSGSFHTVTDTKQAELLTEPRSKAFFKPFLAQERTATEAAAELGCTLNTVLYRIKTLLGAGLLEVTKEEKRKGRAVKHYRSLHDAYFIPFILTPYATLEERLVAQAEPIFGSLLRAYADALRQNERFGNYLLRTPDGSVLTSDLIPEFTPSGLPVLYSDTVVRLEQDEATKLGGALRDLVQRSFDSGQKSEQARSYFFMVALLTLAQ